MRLEDAIARLEDVKEFWMNYDYATDEGKESLTKNAEAIETILHELRDFKEGNIVSLKLLENFYLVSKDKEKQMTLANKELFDDYIHKDKVEDKIEELNVVENAEVLEDIMNKQNYTIVELIQFILKELLGSK